MPTISHFVRKFIEENENLQETLAKDLISQPNLAEYFQPKIEQELGKKIKIHAIVMAIRRYAENLKKFDEKIKFKFSPNLTLKTNIIDISLVRSHLLFKKLEKIYKQIRFEEGDFLNIVHGNKEVNIITSQRYQEIFEKEIGRKNIINVKKELVSVAIELGEDFFYQPGVIAKITRKIAWENINIYEIVSTISELNLIVHKKDANRVFNLVQELGEIKER